MKMSDVKVRTARDNYLAANRLGLESYVSPLFRLKFGKIAFVLPNPGLLPWHDLHHVATGFGTGLIGEIEISAYELRAGCRSFWVHFLCIGSILLGFLVAPRRLLRAWRKSKGTKTLYYTTKAYEELLEMDLADLRSHLGIPGEGLS